MSDYDYIRLDERTRVALERVYLTCTGFLLALGDRAKRKLSSALQGLGMAVKKISTNLSSGASGKTGGSIPPDSDGRKQVRFKSDPPAQNLSPCIVKITINCACLGSESSSVPSQVPKSRMSELAAELSKEPKLLTYSDLSDLVVLSGKSVTLYSVDRQGVLHQDFIV